MTVGEYLRTLRVQKELSITEVVMKSNYELDKTTLSRIESGHRKPSLKAAYMLARIYNVDLERLAEVTIGKKMPSTECDFDTSPGERRLIMLFRTLPVGLKSSVRSIVAALANPAIDGKKELYLREDSVQYVTGVDPDDMASAEALEEDDAAGGQEIASDEGKEE